MSQSQWHMRPQSTDTCAAISPGPLSLSTSTPRALLTSVPSSMMSCARGSEGHQLRINATRYLGAATVQKDWLGARIVLATRSCVASVDKEVWNADAEMASWRSMATCSLGEEEKTEGEWS